MGAKLPSPAESNRLTRKLDRLAAALALIGGAVLLILAGLTLLAILLREVVAPLSALAPHLAHWYGRATFFGGAYEVVEIGTGIAIFCFLPYCQRRNGNVTVDFLMERAPEALRLAVDLLAQALYGGIALLLLWRMSVGARELAYSGESSMVLRLPLWWGFLPALAALLLLVVGIAERGLRVARHLLTLAGLRS